MKEYQGDYEPSYSLHLSQRAMALVRATIILCLTALVIAGSILFYIYSAERFKIIASNQGVYIFDRKDIFLSHCDAEGKCTTVTLKKTPMEMAASQPLMSNASSLFNGWSNSNTQQQVQPQGMLQQSQPLAQQVGQPVGPQPGGMFGGSNLSSGMVDAMQQNRPANALQSAILGQNLASPAVVQNQLTTAQQQLNAQQQQLKFQQGAAQAPFSPLGLLSNPSSGTPGGLSPSTLPAPTNQVGFQTPVTPPQFELAAAPQWNPVTATPGTGVLGTNISTDTNASTNSGAGEDNSGGADNSGVGADNSGIGDTAGGDTGDFSGVIDGSSVDGSGA